MMVHIYYNMRTIKCVGPGLSQKKKKNEKKNLRSIRSSILLEPSLPLRVGPFLELKVLKSVSERCRKSRLITYSDVGRVSASATLNQNKNDSSNNWDKVQWQVHDVSDQCSW